MSFTTPCLIIVKNEDHATLLMEKLSEIGRRKIYEIQNNISYPCICGVSANIISLCDISELSSTGFTDCGTNELLFLAIAALQDDTDYMQWFVWGNRWMLWQYDCSHHCAHSTTGISSVFTRGRKATVPELIEHFKTEG